MAGYNGKRATLCAGDFSLSYDKLFPQSAWSVDGGSVYTGAMSELQGWEAYGAGQDEFAGDGFGDQPFADDLPQEVLFGPWAEGETALQILGPLDGLRVLDLGCGSGENAVVMAQAGASVVGMDISAFQIAQARQLAAQTGVEIELRQGDMHTPRLWEGLTVDLILAGYVLPYSPAPQQVFAHCMKALAPGGRLVLSMDHPLRGCFWDEDAQELIGFPVRAYHDEKPIARLIDETPVRYFNRPTESWMGLLYEAGFVVTRMLEPRTPQARVADLWPAESPLEPLGNLPHLLILVAQRPA